MELDRITINKADPSLRDKLQRAPGDETIRVVMVLGNDESGLRLEDQPHPSQYPTRTAWREALIQRRRLQVAGKIGDTLEDLRRLSLNPQGGSLGTVVVVEGPASKIAKSLELPGVRHATLDMAIGLANVS